MSTSWIIDTSEEIKCPNCLEEKNQKSYPVNIMDSRLSRMSKIVQDSSCTIWCERIIPENRLMKFFF